MGVEQGEGDFRALLREKPELYGNRLAGLGGRAQAAPEEGTTLRLSDGMGDPTGGCS